MKEHGKWDDQLGWQPTRPRRPRWHELEADQRPILPLEAWLFPLLIGFALGVLGGYLLYLATGTG